MSSTQGSFVDSVIIAARENPVAAALIGGGALWLLIGNEKLKSAASLATESFASADTGARSQRSSPLRYEGTPAPPTAPEMDHEGSFGLGESLRHASKAASDTVSKAADQMKDRFDEGTAYARDNFSKLGETLPGTETFTRAQSSFSDLLERQPLGGVDSRDSLLGANQIQGCFWGGSLGCDGAVGFERRGVGADGTADHRPA